MVNSVTRATSPRTDPDVDDCEWSGPPPQSWCIANAAANATALADETSETPAPTTTESPLCTDYASPDHDFDDCVNDTIDNGLLFYRQDGDADPIDSGDVQQGKLGDCYLFASLAALSQTPQGRDLLRRAVVENKNDSGEVTSWTVTLHRPESQLTGTTFRDVKVTVDPTYVAGHGPGRPIRAGHDSPMEIWPLVFEKALAKYLGDYEKLNRGGSPADVLTLLTGHEAATVSLDWPNRLLQGYGCREVAADLAAGKVVVLSSRTGLRDDHALVGPGTPPSAYGLVDGHAYFAIAVEQHDGQAFLRLGNPWGHDQPELVPCAELARWFSSVSVASLH
jgi:hypothetical protein